MAEELTNYLKKLDKLNMPNTKIKILQRLLKSAIEEYKKVIEMKPDNADSYYSLAVAENNLAVDIEQLKVRMNIDDTLFTPNQSGETTIELTDELTEKEKNLVKELYDSAIANYQKYLELNPNADDKQEVETNIQKIQEAQNPNRKQAID